MLPRCLLRVRIQSGTPPPHPSPTKSNHSPGFYQYRLVSPISVFYLNVNIRYMLHGFFCPTLVLKFIYTLAYIFREFIIIVNRVLMDEYTTIYWPILLLIGTW